MKLLKQLRNTVPSQPRKPQPRNTTLTQQVVNVLGHLIVPVGLGAILTLGFVAENVSLSINPTTGEFYVKSAFVKPGKSPKYLVTISKDDKSNTKQDDVVLEITDLWTRGQFEAALLFGEFQSVAGENCPVTVSYAGVDNNIWSIHPFVLQSGTDLTCEEQHTPD
jgi:hypothetical protein